MRFRKFCILAAISAFFSALSAAPALADDDGWRGRGYRHGHHWKDGRHGGYPHGYFPGHGWGHGREHWGHDRHGWRTNFQFIINQGYGPGYDYYDRPYFRTYRRPPPAPYYPGQDGNLLGTLLGGAIGGIAGSQIGDGGGRTASIIGGTVIGALVGGKIGRSPYDHAHAANVFEVTPSNQSGTWQNPDDGIAYQVTPIRTFQANGGRYCREYQALATIGGRQERTYGAACRTPDGDWQIMN